LKGSIFDEIDDLWITGRKSASHLTISFKYYPQMPLMAVTDFSGRRMKLEVIVTPIFPICSIS
jgi:hypothetical protein